MDRVRQAALGARGWRRPALHRLRKTALTALRTSDGSTAWTIPFPDKLVSGARVGPRLAGRGHGVGRPRVARRGRHAGVAAGHRRRPRRAGNRRGSRVSVAERRPRPRPSSGYRRQIWERKLGGPPNEILAIDDRLFVGSNDNFFYCLETKDGAVDWRWRTGADVVSKPMADRDHVYFVSLDNVLRSLNRRNGVQQWKKPLPFRPAWPPLQAADAVVVAGISGSAARVSPEGWRRGRRAGDRRRQRDRGAASCLHVDGGARPDDHRRHALDRRGSEHRGRQQGDRTRRSLPLCPVARPDSASRVSAST